MVGPEWSIRLGRTDELEVLQDIEVKAGVIFAEFGMADIAHDQPLSLATLREYANGARLWVAVDGKDLAVAYLIVDVVDECAHIEQVSVHPDYAGHRIGQALIDTVADWANTQSLPAVTLTTFEEIPWNAPYYQRLGFEIISEADCTPGLRRIRAEEGAHGLNRWPRVCMKKAIC